MSRDVHPTEMIQFSALPVVRRETLALARVVNLDDFVGDQFMSLRFSREIVWVRETSCATIVRKRVSERPLVEGSNRHDYRKLFSSVPEDELVQHYVDEYEASPSGPFVVEVIMTITDKPWLPVPERWRKKSYFNADDPQYLPIPKDWAIDDERVDRWATVLSGHDNMEERFADENRMNYVTGLEENESVVIWSSDWTSDENAAALQTVLDKYSPKQVD